MLYGIGHVPGTTQRRARRDPVSPESRHPRFTSVFRQFQRGPDNNEWACHAAHSDTPSARRVLLRVVAGMFAYPNRTQHVPAGHGYGPRYVHRTALCKDGGQKTVYGGMPGARRAGGAWDHHAGLMREVRPYALLDNEPQKCASRRSIAQYFWRSMASLYVANKAVSSLRKLSVMFYVRSTGFRREFLEINGIRDATSRTLS